MKRIIVLCLAAAVTLGGCSLKRTKPAAEMPPDKPWNRQIMETEKGYYYSCTDDGILALRYHEKSNDADIFLCAKPECSHNGEDTCTATYDFLNTSNYILYDGAIYFVADTSTKDAYGYSLYKASLDGTSLDKVGDIRRVSYPNNRDTGWGSLPEFIIHKGYAYISYNMGQGYDYNDFIENGFAKMNIQTGEVELIFSNDTYMTSLDANVQAGIGDYVYYSTWCSNGDKKRQGTFRYNINDGSSEKITGALEEVVNETGGHYAICGYTEDTLYVRHYDSKIDEIIGYDAKTFEPNGAKIDLKWEYNKYPRTIFYDNKVFVLKDESVEVYSDKGELLRDQKLSGELGKSQKRSYEERSFDISDGKLYIGRVIEADYEHLDDKAEDYEEKLKELESSVYRIFYCCPIQDIIDGKGEWKEVYSVNRYRAYWNEYPAPKFVKENVLPYLDEQ